MKNKLTASIKRTNL